MDGKSSSRKNCQDADADVDHYFLPGGILDTPSHEEDMIGGSLLDEIGGMGNVARLVPQKQMGVIGRVGPEAGIGIPSSGAVSPGSQSGSKSTSVTIEGPARLSVEGTNPMAKEFTPAARPLPSGSAINSRPGGPHSRTSFNTASDLRQRSSSRVFSAAVGSEVKKPAAEFPIRGALGKSGHTSRYQPDWVTRAISSPGHPSPSLAANQRLTIPSQGRLSPPPGLPSRGSIPQRSDKVHRAQVEEMGVSFGQSHRRERGPSNYHSLKPVQSTAGTCLPPETFKPDGYHSVARQQQRNRSQVSMLREAQSDVSDGVIVAKTVGPGGRDDIPDRALRRAHKVDQESASKGPTRPRIPRDSVNVRGETRVQMQKNSVGYDDAVKVSSGGHVDDAQHNVDSAAGEHPKAFSDRPVLTPVETDTGHMDVSQHRVSPRPSPCSKDEGSIPLDNVVDLFDTGALSPRHSEGRWPSSNPDRAPQQVQKDSASFGNIGKPKSKKKEERYANRPGPKHLLGAPTKESSKGKLMTRSNFARSLSALGASARNFSFGLSGAAVKTIAWSFTRFRLIGRMVTLVSLSASMGASSLTVVLTIMSWSLMFWLRIHSVALKEATGSVHVSICFLFPYSFQYLASLVDEWAPHWLPVCLWYSFLMQMFSPSNHLHKSSTASSVVPALRALLPVAFLCEVPSGRSYLLAMEGSELLLLSFTLAAVRLRCLLSPIFLFSWSSQVIAIATFGSCASLQYGQLLLSLASLHAVSIVEVTLNGKFYHARYRAGMSLTNGFRIIPPPSHTLLR